MSDEILYCPFCGGKSYPHAEQVPRTGLDTVITEWFICCRSCAAQGGLAKSKTGAIRNWNMRVNPPNNANERD